MDRSVADAIRQQSEDLRDELKELEQWEDSVRAKEAAAAKRKVAAQGAENADALPPIRGTVPSLKEAMRQRQASHTAAGSQESSAAADPIQQAKEKGNALFQSGHLLEAVAAYTVGIDLDPASSTTHVLYANRAMCYLKLGQWTAAEKDATTCVQMNTGYAKAYYRRAMARKNQGKLKEARTDLEAVLALAPKDASAQQEMVEITKALQAQRAASAAPATSTSVGKKRIIIEEVDSEEDEPDEQPSLGTDAASQLSPEEQQIRQERIDADLQKLAAAREQHEVQTRLEAQRETHAQAQRQRRNQRVEIIEEEEEEVKKPIQEPSALVPDVAPAATLEPLSSGAAASPVHADPVPSPPSAQPSSPSASATSTTAPRPRPPTAKESLTTPKSFTEFERRFREVKAQPELRNYYVSQLQPAALGKLFGSNMTPEMLYGILDAVKTFDGTVALQFAKGLAQVSRVEDMTLFFNAKEKAVVSDVLDLLKSSGAPEKEVQAIQRKLKPF